MVKIERIVCPVDFSEGSVKAYDYAYSLALRYGAKLSVEHVIPIFEYGFPALDMSGCYPDLERNAETELKSLIARHPAKGVEIETAAFRGFVPDSILASAKSQSADLIVMGTHGRRGLDRLVMGSTTEHVLRKACCPVLAVRNPAHDFVNPDSSTETVRLQKILVCTDFSECAYAATDYALSLAQEYNAELLMLHVVEDLPEERKDVLVRTVGERLQGLAPQDARNWCNIKTRVRIGKPYQEIIQQAVEQQADLVVQGVRGRNALDMAIFGSTTQRVLQLGPCPVLAVHTPHGGQTEEAHLINAEKKASGRTAATFLQNSKCPEET